MNELKLDIDRFMASSEVSHRAFLRPDSMSIEQQWHVEAVDRLCLQLNRFMAYLPWDQPIRVPATWWDHFKKRWFPEWALERWPVTYDEYEPRMYFPNLPVKPPGQPDIRLPIMMPAGEGASILDADVPLSEPYFERPSFELHPLWKLPHLDDEKGPLRAAGATLSAVLDAQGLRGVLYLLEEVASLYGVDELELLVRWIRTGDWQLQDAPLGRMPKRGEESP